VGEGVLTVGNCRLYTMHPPNTNGSERLLRLAAVIFVLCCFFWWLYAVIVSVIQ